MRNQIKQANQINSLCSPLCFLVEFREILSQRKLGSPHETIALVFTQYTFMCFTFNHIEIILIAVFQQILRSSHGLQKMFHKFYAFFIWIQENIYPKALPGRRQIGTDTWANCVLNSVLLHMVLYL